MASSTSIKTQQLEHWLVSDLIEYARNPRKNDHAVDKVAAAIREFGFRVPILAKSDKTVVDGHLRLKAAKKLGIETVPVMLCDDMTDAQIKAFRISVNRVAEFADWDEELLRVEFDELADLGFDLELTGFSLDEISELEIEEIAPEYEEDADGEVIEPPPEPKTKEGDVWILGKHRLMCGDSTSIDAVEKLLNGAKIDLVFTDPPYGVDYQGINNDDRGGLYDLLDQAFNNYNLNMKAGASIYVFHSDKCADIFHDVFRKYFHFSSMMIWVKPALVLSQSDYHSRHEPCMYGWNKDGAHAWYSDRKQTTVWEYGKEHIKGHTTPKPTDMICYALENSSKAGHLICDLFGGSGSTLIACEKTNRKAYLMELDPKYCDVIINRWQTLTGKEAVLESTGDKFNDL
jgi:DNA modification methylase